MFTVPRIVYFTLRDSIVFMYSCLDIFYRCLTGEWLDSIKMKTYETNFVETGYKSKSEITELTDEDLITIGITLIGHRNKIMKGINSLKSKKKGQSI